MAKKVFTLLLAVMLVLCYIPGMAFADADGTITTSNTQFADMPNDWSKAGLENAVANGLIKGYQDAGGLYIKPNGTLTRAEMATVVNRAFGAQEKASLSGANDVQSGAWYEAEMAKAVQMGTMKKDSQMRPNANITRQEACTILARAFKMKSSSNNALDHFADKGNVASWAKESLSALVETGNMSGAGGNLNPTANMTRAEFAKIMDNMVKQYVTTAGTVEKVVDKGNVMVNVPGVTLKNVTINGNLIIGDGVGNGELSLDNVKVTGDTIVRGGGVNSIIIKGDSNIGNIIIAKVNGNVRVAVEGNAKVSVVVIADGKNDVKVEGKIATLKVEAETPVLVQKAEIANVEVTAANEAVTVAKDATVTNLKVEASKAKLSINGTVKTIIVAKNASGAKIAIAKDAKVDKLEANANVSTSGEGKPATTTGTGTVTNEKGEATKPVTPSTGGGGGGGGGGSTPTPNYEYYLSIDDVASLKGLSLDVTPLVKNQGTNKGNFGNLITNAAIKVNGKLDPTKKNSIGEVLKVATASGIDFNMDAHNSKLVAAYNKYLNSNTDLEAFENFENLFYVLATILDDVDETKIKAECNAFATHLENIKVTTKYNGKDVEMTSISVDMGKPGADISFNIGSPTADVNINTFVDAVYNENLETLIGSGASLSLNGKYGSSDKLISININRYSK